MVFSMSATVLNPRMSLFQALLGNQESPIASTLQCPLGVPYLESNGKVNKSLSRSLPKPAQVVANHETVSFLETLSSPPAYSLPAYAAFFAAFTLAQRFFAPAIILAFASGLITLLVFFAAGAVAGAGAGTAPVLPFNFAHRA